MIQETEAFLELELNRDTVPAPPPEEEEALFFSFAAIEQAS
jgi:hypothetical protein